MIDIISAMRRPRHTFWSPLGWSNTFYLDTRTWARTPTKAQMDSVNDEIGKLDK